MVFLEGILAGERLKKMRIISGNFKNKKLNFPKNFKTRPLKDRVRENIFNIIEHSTSFGTDIKDSFVLDLYAGIGSFGIESVSRGAKKSFFVENNIEALKNLKKNIDLLKLENNVEVYSENVLRFIEKYNFKFKFDIIFLDPPYKDKEFLSIFDNLKKKNILKKEHLIILHREKKTTELPLKLLNILESRIYGRSEIFFLKLL